MIRKRVSLSKITATKNTNNQSTIKATVEEDTRSLESARVKIFSSTFLTMNQFFFAIFAVLRILVSFWLGIG